MDIGDFDALAWYRNIPPVSRAYLTATVAVTVLATLELLSPFDLYYNSTLIMQGQVWRLATSFLFFGQLGLGFFLNMFFTMQQCIALEQGFGGAGGTADFLFFVLLAAAGLLACAPLVTVTFFSTAFMQVIVYVWSKRNPHAGMALFGVVPFRGAWLPYVLIGMSLAFGHSLEMELLGIAVGHVYFYLADVWPALAAHRGWSWRRVIVTPRILYWLTGTLAAVDAREERLRQSELARIDRLAREAEERFHGGAGAGAEAEGAAGGPAQPAAGGDVAQHGGPVPRANAGADAAEWLGGEDAELAASLEAIAELERREAEAAAATGASGVGDDGGGNGQAAADRASDAQQRAGAPAAPAPASIEAPAPEAATRLPEGSRAGGGPVASPAGAQVAGVMDSTLPDPARSPDVAPPATISASELRRRRQARFEAMERSPGQ
ncbi:hypothetical protein FNF31_05048 [Cafeteria roenbergensis]|uniref:Derlin n=1 Tax=Cafeteria roenbergensis TaxID=33653 RepID=A0A5A8D1W7_CAFRO|nr:hypothetical protein FNF31_05048 [Cafeteria roenbergensis]